MILVELLSFVFIHTYANMSGGEPLKAQDSVREELTATGTVDDDGASINGVRICVERRKIESDGITL